ncbi:MAG TPA: ubiquinol-cytochrome C chaperone family protein [Pseudolabrys sp.]|nr:ubiquinol-cytochrome C chaperone family protein [Pseudolabrys sp.]
MIPRIFRRQPSPAAVSLYDQIVAQARSPGFYRDYGVFDTLDGRFEMVVLHLFLLLDRLESAGDNGAALGQQVFDRFCQDMDENLREIGISDLKVPHEMRRVGEAYYGRAQVYRAALRDREKLTAALVRNAVEAAQPEAASRLAAYMGQVAQLLAGQELGNFERGFVSFPDL